MSVARSAQLAVLYEHPQWFQPLFAALDGRGMPYLPVNLSGHRSSCDAPAPLVLGRVARSSILGASAVAHRGSPNEDRASRQRAGARL